MKEKLNEGIVNLLMSVEGFVKANKIAQDLGVNERTVRRRINLINQSLFEGIGHIESKKGQGFRLYIYDKVAFLKSFDYSLAEPGMNSRANRIARIFELLVTSPYRTKRELEEEFYISETTLAKDIKELNNYGKSVNVKVKFSNTKGYFISGEEYFIRNTLLKLIYDSGEVRVRRRNSRIQKDKWVNAVKKIFQEEKIYINKHTLDAIVNYLSASARRIQFGYSIQREDLKGCQVDNEKIKNISRRLADEVGKEIETKFSIEEKEFFSFFLLSVLPLEVIQPSKMNKEYKQAKDFLMKINQKLEEVGLFVQSQNCDDDILRFLYGLFLRIRFDIQKREKIFIDVESTCPQAYFISKLIFQELGREMGISFSKEEVAYFSLILNNYYFLSEPKEKKILAILPTDYTVARMYITELRHFSKYEIDLIDYESFLENNELKDKKYSLVLNPFGSIVKFKNTKVYNINDIITRGDFVRISRFLTYKNFSLLEKNLPLITELSKKDLNNLICETTYFGSTIGFTTVKTVQSMGYKIEDVDGVLKYHFLISSKLSFEEIADLMKVSLDVVMKLESKKELLTKEKLVDFYLN